MWIGIQKSKVTHLRNIYYGISVFSIIYLFIYYFQIFIIKSRFNNTSYFILTIIFMLHKNSQPNFLIRIYPFGNTILCFLLCPAQKRRQKSEVRRRVCTCTSLATIAWKCMYSFVSVSLTPSTKHTCSTWWKTERKFVRLI